MKGWTLDLGDRAAIGAVIEDIAAHFGGIDILVNNAGISIPTRLDSDDYESVWDRSIAVLLTAHPLTRGGVRCRGHHGQLHLPGAHPHGHD